MVRSNIMSAPYNAAVMSGVTATAGELNTQAGVTAGTVAASKAVVVDGSKDIGTFGALTAATLTGTTSVTGAAVVGTATVQAPAIDAGASGTAGSVDIFPSTGSKGKIALTAADSAGNTTTTIVNASQAGARTYTIPDALANADFMLGKQGAVAITANADGLTTAVIPDGGRFQFVTITSANAGHFVTLPTPTPGTVIEAFVGANGCKVRTSTPGSIGINGGTGAAASITLAASTYVRLFCASATAWYGFSVNANTLAATGAAA